MLMWTTTRGGLLRGLYTSHFVCTGKTKSDGAIRHPNLPCSTVSCYRQGSLVRQRAIWCPKFSVTMLLRFEWQTVTGQSACLEEALVHSFHCQFSIISFRWSLAHQRPGYQARARAQHKLQAVVYDILPSTTAVFSYTIGFRKLSANEQFFVGAQTVVSLLQTTQIISDVCFITDHVYASSNKTKIIWIEMKLFFYLGWMHLMFTCMLGC